MSKDQEPRPSLLEELEAVGDKPILKLEGDSLTIYYRVELTDLIERERYMENAFGSEPLVGGNPLARSVGWLRINQQEPLPNGLSFTHTVMPSFLPRLLGQLEERQFDTSLSEPAFVLLLHAINGLKGIIEPKPPSK